MMTPCSGLGMQAHGVSADFSMWLPTVALSSHQHLEERRQMEQQWSFQRPSLEVLYVTFAVFSKGSESRFGEQLTGLCLAKTYPKSHFTAAYECIHS